jgi:hypothetical protein
MSTVHVIGAAGFRDEVIESGYVVVALDQRWERPGPGNDAGIKVPHPVRDLLLHGLEGRRAATVLRPHAADVRPVVRDGLRGRHAARHGHRQPRLKASLCTTPLDSRLRGNDVINPETPCNTP